MGTTLTGKVISATYDALLKVTDNDAITSTAKRITDGLGNDTPLYISTTRIGIGVSPTTTFHVSGNSQIGGNLTVTGDLLVEGSTTTIDTETLSVEDPLIIVGSNNTTSDAVDLGIYGVYDTSGSQNLYAGIFRRAADNKFHLFKDLQTEPTTTVNLSGTGYTKADLVIGNLEATQVDLGDNEQIRLGDSEDLKIYHNGTNSYITNVTGNFEIITTGSLILQDASANKWMMTNQSGNVLLYNAGSVKLSTSSTGVTVTGTIIADGLDLGDSEKIRLGDSQDLEIYHDGSNSLISTISGGDLYVQSTNDDVIIRTTADDKDIFIQSDDGSGGVATYFQADGSTGAVNLYHYGSKKFETSSTGVTVTENLTVNGTSISLSNATNPTITVTDSTNGHYLTMQGLDGASKIDYLSTLIFEYGASNTEAARLNSSGLTITEELTVSGTGQSSFTGQVTIPATPVADTDAASKGYVDGLVEGQDTLAEILANGNTTGGTDIEVNGDNIVFGYSTTIGTDDTLIFGASNDFRLAHNGTDSVIRSFTGGLYIDQEADDNDIIFRADDGAGGKTTYFVVDGGIVRTRFYVDTEHRDNVIARFGSSGDLKIYHDGTDSAIENITGHLYIQNYADDKDIIFQSDNGSGGTTNYMSLDGSATRVNFFVNTRHSDNVKALFGGGGDLQIYHDGSNSYIYDTGTGRLNVRTNQFRLVNAANSEIIIDATENGSVDLYYDNSKKFETTSTGVQVTGTANSNALYLYEGDFTMHGGSSGQNDIRWINTWGNWRIEVGDGANNFKIHSESLGEDYLTIDGSGNVGINETSPDTILHISDGNTSDPSTNAPVIRLQNTSENCSAFFTDGDVIGGLEFYNDSIICTDIAYAAGVNAYFRAVHDGASSPTPTSSLEFGTGTGGSASTKMTIDSSGDLYVGGSTNYGKVTIEQGGDVSGLVINNTTAHRPRLYLRDAGGAGYSEILANNDLYLNASAVGIGTTSPNAKLEVRNDVAASTDLDPTAIKLYNNFDGGSAIEFSNSVGGNSKISFGVESTGAGTDDTFLGFSTGQNTGLSERMRIDSSGGVGIGATTIPADHRLQIHNPSFTYSRFALTNSATGSASGDGLKFQIENLNAIIKNQENGYLTFGTNGRETDLRIDSSGNVGINETSPSSYFSPDLVVKAKADLGGITIRSNATSHNNYLMFADGTTGNERYRGYVNYNHSADSMTFGSAAVARMTIDSSGTTTITNGTFDNTLLLLNGARGRRLRVQEHNTGNGGIAITSQDDNETGTTNANNRTLLLNASGGNVGIGTDSPTNLLDIKSNGSSKGLDIHHSNGNIVAQLIHGGSGDEGQLKLYDSNVETVRISGENNIDSYINSGNLLINQTSSATTAKLQVDGDIDMTGSAPTAIRLYDGVTFKGGLGDGQWAFGSTSYANDYALYAQNDLLFHAGTGSSIDMMIDGANHNVGIGVTSPTYKLHVGGALRVNGLSSGTSVSFGGSGDFAIDAPGVGGGRFIVKHSSGNVGIGTASPTYKFHVASSNNVSIFEDTSGSSGATFCLFNAPSVFAMGSITRNGTANSVLFNTGSDYRLKEDLRDFNALDLVDNITAYDYKWKDTEQRDYGFVAHELQEVMPNVVTGEKDGERMQSVDYSKLTPVLLKAIQELKAEIETLKAQINN